VFRKSSFCQNSACVEADLDWHTASASQNNGGCVQAAWQKAQASANGDCVEAQWTKSARSYANGDCVEAAWARSSYTQPDACVEAQWDRGKCQLNDCAEVRTEPACGLVHLRDSKDPDGTVLDYPREEWDGGNVVTFIPVSKSVVPDGLVKARDSRAQDTANRDQWYQVTRNGASLWFDQAEVDAFRSGVADAEFALEVPA
jgi:Domain of unknown function (DUF397)